MSTRQTITAAALAAGWREVGAPGSYFVEFVRDVTLDPTTKLGEFIAHFDWTPREAVWVQFTDSGGVNDAVRRTPAQQAALSGRFTGWAEQARGRGKKERVLAWLKAPPWTPREEQ